MHIIIGLGNPTRQYEGTRHNVGFEAIDRIAKENGIPMDMKKHKAICGKGMIGFEKVILAKPQTFMNLSGESVRELVDFYKVDPENILVIYDDIDLDVGHLRIRARGSAGGHNGMKNIIQHLSGEETFPRIRVGVGAKPQGWDLADYVLGRYNSEDRKKMDDALGLAAEAAKLIVNDDMNAAMNRYNTKKPKKPKQPKVKKEAVVETQAETSAETPAGE